jgi:hypothetical protein
MTYYVTTALGVCIQGGKQGLLFNVTASTSTPLRMEADYLATACDFWDTVEAVEVQKQLGLLGA